MVVVVLQTIPRPEKVPARQHRRPHHRRCRMLNVHPCEERRRSAPASVMDVVSDGGRGGHRAPSTPAPCHTPPQQHVDCHFPFKARRCCPPAPATPSLPNDARHRPHAPTIPLALSPSSRWLRRPRHAGAVVVHRSPSSGVCPSSSTALVWGARRDSS